MRNRRLFTALIIGAAVAGSLLAPALTDRAGTPATTVVAEEKPANCGTANTPPCEA